MILVSQNMMHITLSHLCRQKLLRNGWLKRKASDHIFFLDLTSKVCKSMLITGLAIIGHGLSIWLIRLRTFMSISSLDFHLWAVIFVVSMEMQQVICVPDGIRLEHCSLLLVTIIRMQLHPRSLTPSTSLFPLTYLTTRTLPTLTLSEQQ